jgi:hypothetical protein
MRTLTHMSVMLLLVIASGLAVAPALAGTSTDLALVAADQDRADDDDDDDKKRGRGNDDDDDDRNRGRGNDDDDDKANSREVSATEGYRVEVECDVDDDDDTTECEFSGIAPSDASDIDRITVPADAVCAEVIDGDFVLANAQSGAGVTGYMSEDDDDELELELVGRVTTTRTMTYWVTTSDGVFPAEGPGLRCYQAQGAVATVTPPPPTPEVTTGTLAVAVYSCGNVPDDTSMFDWFAECVPGSDPIGFLLTPSGENAVDRYTTESDATGEAAFEMLDPGTYRLEAIDRLWCHATSDRVTSDSEVVVRAAEQTTVWTFYCDEGTR